MGRALATRGYSRRHRRSVFGTRPRMPPTTTLEILDAQKSAHFIEDMVIPVTIGLDLNGHETSARGFELVSQPARVLDLDQVSINDPESRLDPIG